jgi:cytochrome c556
MMTAGDISKARAMVARVIIATIARVMTGEASTSSYSGESAARNTLFRHLLKRRQSGDKAAKKGKKYDSRVVKNLRHFFSSSQAIRRRQTGDKQAISAKNSIWGRWR